VPYYFRKYSLIFVLATFLTGCDTVYQEMSWDGGYENHQLNEHHYWLKYTGNSTTPANWVLSSWHRRAKELCNTRYKTIKLEIPQVLHDSQTILQTPLNRHNPIVVGEILCLNQP